MKPEDRQNHIIYFKCLECLCCHKKKRGLIPHHYPIPDSPFTSLLNPKGYKGTETIPVCPSCHQKDHGAYPDWLIQRMIYEIEEVWCIPDPDLYAERKKLVQGALKRAKEKPKFVIQR